MFKRKLAAVLAAGMCMAAATGAWAEQVSPTALDNAGIYGIISGTLSQSGDKTKVDASTRVTRNPDNARLLIKLSMNDSSHNVVLSTLELSQKGGTSFSKSVPIPATVPYKVDMVYSTHEVRGGNAYSTSRTIAIK